jgi:signal transduction histidine kinase
MTWTFAFLSNFWPTAAALCLLLLLAGYSWHRKSVPGALPFMVGCLFTILLTTGLLMANLAADPGARSFWLRFMFSWVLPSITAVTCFILEYAWPGRWLSRRNLILFSILPLFCIYYFLGGGYVYMVPSDFATKGTVTLPLNLFGMLSIGYFLALTLINLLVFTWLFIRSPQHRWPILLMAASQISMRLIIFGQEPSLSVAVINLPSFTIPYLAYAIALFGFRIFDPVGLASQTAVDQLSAGLFVLDSQGKVVSANLLGEQMLNQSEGKSKGKNFYQIIPVSLGQRLDHTRVTKERVIEFSLAEQSDAPGLRDYTLTVLPLKDWRGFEVGSLLLLRDVTEPKQAREKEKQEHLLLAILEERERLARELHDSLGQVLGYASFQIGAAAKLSREGQGVAAADQLDRLGEAVRTAHADLREHILNLSSTASLTQPFFPVVRQYLEGFSSSYEIQTCLEVDPGLAEKSFAPEQQLQLFRILQESLSNARKHGAARLVEVAFTLADGYLHLSIQDDGGGFDPQRVFEFKEPHYGLQFMRERAEQLKGSLQVQSAPGSGTCVLMKIPYKE